MVNEGIQLFSAAALAVLNRQVWHPAAKGQYEVMSGGLIWPDEFPTSGSTDWESIAPGWVYRYLVAYRASITIGEEREPFWPVWEQVVQQAPKWPGLLFERRGEHARKRLLAAKRREARCLDQMEN